MRDRKRKGPRRRHWERLKRRDDYLRAKILQFHRDLASYDDAHPERTPIDRGPILSPPPLPAMPPWEQ